MDAIVERMEVVLGGIGRTADEDALFEIARAAEGAMRDALSLLDCCLSYTDGSVTLELARDVLGSTGRAFLFDFADALIDFDSARALLLINEMVSKGCDPQVFARDVTAHLRALLLAGAVGDISQLLEITPEDAARFSEQATRIDSARLTRLMDLFMRAEPDMKWASRPRTVLELAAVRACHPEREEDSDVSERMDRLEKLVQSGAIAPAKPAKAAAPAAESAEKKPAAPKSAPAQPLAAPPQEYLDAIETIGQEIPSIRATLPSMAFVSYDAGVLTVQFSKKQLMHMRMLERKKAALEELFARHFGAPLTLRMVQEGDAAAKSAPSVGATAKRVIEESYDLFGREKISLE